MTIFEFSNFREFIKFRVSQQLYNSKGRKKSNLVGVSKALGYNSPSLLSMVMNGKRLPSDGLCEAMARKWNLSLKEREYLRLLVQLDRKRGQGEDTAETVEMLRRVGGKRSAYVFNENEFSMIREWYYLVIKQMVETPSFNEDPAWISKVLRRKVTPAQCKNALEKMLEMNILERDAVTGRLKCVAGNTETSHEIPSSAIRIHHREMLNRAIEALEDRPVDERLFNSLTFTLDAKRLPEIRGHLLEFMRWLDAEFSSPSAESVFQVGLQLFEHTQTTKPIKN